MTEYQQREYDKKIKLLNELNDMGGVYQFELIENKNESDRSDIVLTGLIPVYVNLNDYQGKYSFYLRHHLPYVGYDTQHKVEADHKMPQNVGVLTTNKIKAWVEFFIKVYEQLVIISGNRVKDINDFEAKAKAEGAVIGNKDSYGAFKGRIIKNGIEFEFEVLNEGYISKKIEVHYSVNDTLADFLALADNKYQHEYKKGD